MIERRKRHQRGTQRSEEINPERVEVRRGDFTEEEFDEVL